MSLNSASTSSPASGLFRGVSYQPVGDSYQPVLLFDAQEFVPIGQTFTLTFDKTTRYCLGWRELATSTPHPCPDSNQTDPKYDTCPACQKRTGFNPAFYNASSVSPQQEKLNQEPHILYLAHFGDDYIKVGISRQKRGIKRLLEQGARSALILDTLPTALIARQYEAKIARLSGVYETTSVATKLKLLERPYYHENAKKLLLATRTRIETELQTKFSTETPLSFDAAYSSGALTPESFTPLTDPTRISGTCVGLVGDILVMRYDTHLLSLPLKKLAGYNTTLAHERAELHFSPTQASLF